MTRYRDDPYFFRCRHCGRTWDAGGGIGTWARAKFDSGERIGANTGFVAAASDSHESLCAVKTPAQRRATNRRDEARWAKHPPKASRIANDPQHPGLQG